MGSKQKYYQLNLNGYMGQVAVSNDATIIIAIPFGSQKSAESIMREFMLNSEPESRHSYMPNLGRSK